mmetsp:Transcript_21611/g.48949  ORF Transcript_21611/g.48949 Transcript_21611/m.48949 type:complete len:87 (+) Transcript_21611:627-887(+)
MVRWDSTGLAHTYMCGKFSVYHLAVFDYLEQKAWMVSLHERNFKQGNSGKPPPIEKQKELETLMGYRMEEQLTKRVSYQRKKCLLQ